MTNKKYDTHTLSQLTDQQLDEFLDGAQQPFTDEQHKRIYQSVLSRKNQEDTGPKERMRFKWALVAIACMLSVPTTVFGITKAWQVLVERNQQSLSLNVTKTNEAPNWYQLDIGYVPDEVTESTDQPLVFNKVNQDLPVLSMMLYQVSEQARFEELYIGEHQETRIDNRRVLKANKEGQAFGKYQEVVYVMFEEEGYVLQVYVGAGISEQEVTKMLGSMVLTESNQSQATKSVDYEAMRAQQKKEETQVEERLDAGILKEGKFAQLNQEVITIWNDVESVAVKAHKVEVLTSLAGIEGEFQLGNEAQLIDDQGNFIPFEVEIYRYGDGKTTIDRLEAIKKLELRFLLVTVTVANQSDKTIENIEFAPNLYHLTESEEGYQARGLDQPPVEPYGFQHAYQLAYLDKQGVGKAYAQIPILLPGQETELKLGYFVTTEETRNNFLELNLMNSQYETLGAEGRQWIKVN